MCLKSFIRKELLFLDYESIKRLGLDHIGIDANNSFETYDSSLSNHTIFIHLLKPEEVVCPLCGTYNDFINRGTKSQLIKYSSSLEDNITIKLYRRVYKCNSCGHTFKEPNPFLESKRQISIFKDYKILEALKSITTTYTEVAERFHVSPTYVINTFDKKVDIKKLELSTVICVDEVYSKRLSYHHYCFIIYNPKDRKIIDVLDSRHLDKLEDYFFKIPKIERDKVKYFSTDLYDNYRLLAKKCLPNALICADSFHVIKNLSDCFHRVRIKIMKRYSYLKNQNDNYYWLFKTYWRLLTIDQSKLSYKKYKRNRNNEYLSTNEIVEYMLSIDNELRLAYDLLHEYRHFNEVANETNCEEWLNEIILKYQNSHISEYIPAWKLLLNWKNEITNSFIRFNGYRVSNGPMERVNRDIKTLFRTSFGSTNFERMRNRIMYSINANSAILYKRKDYTNKKIGKPSKIDPIK